MNFLFYLLVCRFQVGQANLNHLSIRQIQVHLFHLEIRYLQVSQHNLYLLSDLDAQEDRLDLDDPG